MIQANTNNRWAQLSQGEKAELLGIYTRAGYNDLASIIAHYNSCGGKLKADGGPVINTAQYKSDAYLYNPPVNVGAPIEAPLRYKPLPDYGDYEPQRTTGMLEDIPIEIGLEMPQKGYGVLIPDAPSTTTTLDARQDAARRIMAVENSKNNVNGGYDAKTGRWYPHKSHEGGADTIAYGIKLSNGTPEAALALKQGYLTDEQAVSAVDSLVQKYYDAAKKVYDGKYGAGEWDKLSDKSQSILVDYSYNPGLAKFPKLMEGFHSGNLDLIRQNYKRYVNGKELGRNKVLLEELDTLENEYPIFRANGGRIHIKPENRGKFTALKKRTGHSASWFKEHGTPAQKKMAVFALNARKWNHADGGPLGEENEIQVNHIPNWTVFGTDYSTWKPSDIQNIIDWGYTDPESFFGEEGESTRNALSRAGMADSVIGDIYANIDPELQSKFGDRYKGTKQRQQEYTGRITNTIDSAGQRIYQIADTVAGFVPGPVGMIDWLGHMGADAAEGEFGKVGKDLALAAGLGFGARALGKGVRYLKGYLDEIGNFGEDAFRAFVSSEPNSIESVNNILPIRRNVTPRALFDEEGNFIFGGEDAPIINDALAGNRSTAPTKTFLASAPTIAKTTSSGYQIERYPGYMLQSLMEGNALEKQIGRNGTVSANNIKALMKNAKKVDQAVVGKVLASEEFAGKKSIDYNKFRKAVQDELITYDRTPDTRWADYGMERIGIDDLNSDTGIIGFPKDFVKEVLKRDKTLKMESISSIHPGYYKIIDANGNPLSSAKINSLYPEINFELFGVEREKLPTTSAETYTFSSSRIPNGSAKHYDPNTLGHSRTYTTVDEPDVLHVMESQSDWAQQRKGGIQLMDMTEENFLNDKAYFEQLIGDLELKGIAEEEIAPFRDELSKLTKNYKDHFDYNSKNSQLNHLIDNYTSRQIQENLRYAAEKGQTKMRYPTRETAAKIEGYPEREAYFDASGRDITADGPVYTYGDDVDKRIAEINNRIDYLESEPGGEEAMAEYSNLLGERMRLLQGEAKLKPGITKKTVYDYEDILRKYTEFPKRYQKLYKGADVRTVTDPKGNTWYEVDVPEGYLQQEWAYKNGGKLQQYADFSGFF